MGIFFGSPERRSMNSIFPVPPIPPYLGADVTGSQTVTSNPDVALTNSTVWACVSLMAGAVSSLPLETYRKSAGNPNAVPQRIADGPFITRPDETMTQSEWLHMLVVSLLLRGNAIGRITSRDVNFRPLTVNLLHPDKVRVMVDKDTGKLEYRVGHDNRLIPTEDVWHVRGLTMPGSYIGLSPISYAAATLGIDLGARRFATGFFEGDGIPKAVLETDQQLQQEQARTMKDRLMATLRGREPIILGSGLKYTQIQVKPEESQFLATQQATVSQIARFFGPTLPTMVGGNEGSNLTYSNREQRSLDFLTYDLAHWLKRIEDAMFSLLPGQQYVRFNVSQILRPDVETQTRVYIQLLAGKVIAPSEVRADLGRDPMTQAQKDEANLVPLTVTPLGGPKALPGLKVQPGVEAPVPSTDMQGAGSAA